MRGVSNKHCLLTFFISKEKCGYNNIIAYFFRKLGKMFQNLSSAAVMIGALRVKLAEYLVKNLNFWSVLVD